VVEKLPDGHYRMQRDAMTHPVPEKNVHDHCHGFGCLQ
jgi:hypothetical protein